VQGCFVTDKEVEQVVGFIKSSGQADYSDDILEEIEKQAAAEKPKAGDGGGFDDQDSLLPEAIECVVEAGQASTSFLQRRLKLGYARAARIMDDMEQRGVVGPQEGSKPRQVLITKQQWIERNLNQNND
ncbi:MAG: DNA translocase FtsK, partial [Massilioclostridium sp.]|nr:DNA translocase FtsK [Massilioclostridium sp.]